MNLHDHPAMLAEHAYDPPRCGTYAGYQHHRKATAEACEACVQARRAYVTSHRADAAKQRRAFARLGVWAAHQAGDKLALTCALDDILDLLEAPGRITREALYGALITNLTPKERP